MRYGIIRYQLLRRLDLKKKQCWLTLRLLCNNQSSVDLTKLAEILPYGQSTFKVISGGLDITKPDGKGATVVANVAVIVSFNMERANDQ